MLPIPPLAQDVVEVEGIEVKIHSLTHVEAIKMATFDGDREALANHVLSCGTGISADEARQWRAAVAPEVARAVIDGILVLSGLVEGAQKSGGEPSGDG